MRDERPRLAACEISGLGDERAPAPGSYGKSSKYSLFLLQLFRQRIVTDVLDNFLTLRTAKPIEIGCNLSFVLVRIQIIEQITPNRIFAADNVLFSGFDRGRIRG